LEKNEEKNCREESIELDDMQNKRILLIFPANFLKRNYGSAVAVYTSVKMLKSMYENCLIDMFSTNVNEDFSDFELYNTEGLINRLYVADTRKNKVLMKIHRKIRKMTGLYYPDSFVTDAVLKQFRALLKTTRYDFIYVHYPNWVDLFFKSDIPAETKIVYNMHDSDFLQCAYNHGINLAAKRFEKEFNALKIFDRIICNAFDEMLFWSKLLPDKECFFLPFAGIPKTMESHQKEIDVLFVAANNPHNIKGAEWFLDGVLSFLPEDISIVFCGHFLKGLSQKHLGIIKNRGIKTVDFADNLESLYAKTKIVIVPILGGTGIKIKIIEAMSYGIPVVSTLLGVDGLPDKYENGCLVADDPKDFAEYIKRLLSDDDFYRAASDKIKRYFNNYISQERNMDVLKKAFR
jgi:glycosyltransferase involved in cell wall biosynthesis